MLRRLVPLAWSLAAALLLTACASAPPAEEADLPADLQHALERYRRAPGVKMLALNVHPAHGWIWGYATGQLTRNDARDVALGSCEATRRQLGMEQPCVIYMQGQSRVAPLPEPPEIVAAPARVLPPELQEALDAYESLPAHRAFAMAVDPGGASAWGYSHGQPDAAAAERVAMDNCEENRGPAQVEAPCTLWLRGDSWVGNRPE